MTRVVLICSFYAPELGAAVNRVREYSRAFMREPSVDYRVITSFPTYPTGVKPHRYRRKIQTSETGEFGEPVTRLYTTNWSKAFVSKLGNQLMFAFMLGQYCLRFLFVRNTVFIVSSPSFFAIIPVYLLSLVRRCDYVLDVRDPYPVSLFELSGLVKRDSLPGRILLALEARFYRRARRVFTVSESIIDFIMASNPRIAARGIGRERFGVIYNGVSADFIGFGADEAHRREIAARYRGRFVVLFSGTMGKAEDIEAVLEAAAILEHTHPKMLFLFVGDGEKRGMVAAHAARLRNVALVDPVSHRAVAAYIRVANVGLSIRHPSPLEATALPVKIFEYLAMGLPVIYGGGGEAERVIAGARGGIALETTSGAALAAALRTVHARKTTLRVNREYIIRNFSRETQAKKMVAEIVSPHSPPCARDNAAGTRA